MIKKLFSSKYIPIYIVSGISVAIYLFLFSELFNPYYIDWILQAKSDPFQHFVSWLFYRAGPWQLPLNAPLIAYPVGISIVFTDSIPICAIFFKLLSGLGLAPAAPFQYFGFWLLLCFILQGVLGYILIKKIVNSEAIAVIGSVFFLISPPMLLRMGGHMALSAHFLILIALYLYIVHTTWKYAWMYWTLLFIVALLVHPYLFVMIGAVYSAKLAKMTFVNKSLSLWLALLFLCSHMLIVVSTMFLAGYFAIDSGVSVGFGNFSMNVLSIINPSNGQGALWSQIIPAIGTGPYQYEGFNYVGIGIVLQLVLLAFFFFKYVKQYKKLVVLLKRNWPLLVIVIVLTLFALSDRVMLGSHTLLDLNLPKRLENMFNIFRSSGRFFWPVFYILILFSFSLYRFISKQSIQIAVVLFFVLIQLIDFFPKLQEINHHYEHIKYSSRLVSSEWMNLATTYNHVAFVPAITPSYYEDIAFWAATNDMTINSMYTAREVEGENISQQELIAQVQAGNLDKDTVYIFQVFDLENYITSSTKQFGFVQNIDGYTILTPRE